MKDNSSGYLSMALAYLEIGKVSAKSESELRDTDEFENAIAYQLFHSVELFYKFMLSRKGVTKKVHDISALENEYRIQYPGERYKLDHPFNFSCYESSVLNPDEDAKVEEHLGKFKPEFMDQHLRYPSNNNTGGYSFKFEPCYFDRIKEDMLKISAAKG